MLVIECDHTASPRGIHHRDALNPMHRAEGSIVHELFASGRIVDIILGLIALEAAFFAALRSRSGLALDLTGLLYNSAAGAFLLLALRVALVQGHWIWAALSLLAALAAHALDVWRRLQRLPKSAELSSATPSTPRRWG
jgi:hypothetical protein